MKRAPPRNAHTLKSRPAAPGTPELLLSPPPQSRTPTRLWQNGEAQVAAGSKDHLGPPPGKVCYRERNYAADFHLRTLTDSECFPLPKLCLLAQIPILDGTVEPHNPAPYLCRLPAVRTIWLFASEVAVLRADAEGGCEGKVWNLILHKDCPQGLPHCLNVVHLFPEKGVEDCASGIQNLQVVCRSSAANRSCV